MRMNAFLRMKREAKHKSDVKDTLGLFRSLATNARITIKSLAVKELSVMQTHEMYFHLFISKQSNLFWVNLFKNILKYIFANILQRVITDIFRL